MTFWIETEVYIPALPLHGHAGSRAVGQRHFVMLTEGQCSTECEAPGPEASRVLHGSMSPFPLLINWPFNLSWSEYLQTRIEIKYLLAIFKPKSIKRKQTRGLKAKNKTTGNQ